MEKSIGQTQYQELVQWQHPRDSKLTWSYVKHKGPHKSNDRDDCVVVAPIINKDSEPEIVFESHIRPPRMSRANSGITIEPVGGLATDKAANGGLEQNAKRELEEEMGLKVSKMHQPLENIPGDVGAMDGSCSIFVAECEGKVKPKENDESELAIFSVPLKDSIKYLLDATKRGVDVTTVSIIGALNALKELKIQPEFDGAIPKPKLLWSAIDNNPNAMQQDGLAALKRKTEFLPEAAVSKKKPSSFLSKIWGWFKSLFSR
ncbi:MAG: NUDIX domain-containing protein [Candidatus Melainabacteria bacterium]|nr:NUDIX domain-containing protein [Candidatus Melainabacteria bacterium]